MRLLIPLILAAALTPPAAQALTDQCRRFDCGYRFCALALGPVTERLAQAFAALEDGGRQDIRRCLADNHRFNQRFDFNDAVRRVAAPQDFGPVLFLDLWRDAANAAVAGDPYTTSRYHAFDARTLDALGLDPAFHVIGTESSDTEVPFVGLAWIGRRMSCSEDWYRDENRSYCVEEGDPFVVTFVTGRGGAAVYGLYLDLPESQQHTRENNVWIDWIAKDSAEPLLGSDRAQELAEDFVVVSHRGIRAQRRVVFRLVNSSGQELASYEADEPRPAPASAQRDAEGGEVEANPCSAAADVACPMFRVPKAWVDDLRTDPAFDPDRL